MKNIPSRVRPSLRHDAVVADEALGAVEPSSAAAYYGGQLIGESISPEIRRRLIAAWNACEDMPIDHLERLAAIGQGAMLLSLYAFTQVDNLRRAGACIERLASIIELTRPDLAKADEVLESRRLAAQVRAIKTPDFVA